MRSVPLVRIARISGRSLAELQTEVELHLGIGCEGRENPSVPVGFALRAAACGPSPEADEIARWIHRLKRDRAPLPKYQAQVLREVHRLHRSIEPPLAVKLLLEGGTA